MLNKKLFNALKTSEKTVVINDVLSLHSYIPYLKEKYVIALEIRSGYKTHNFHTYVLKSDSLDTMIESIRDAIKEHSKMYYWDMLRDFNGSR